MGKVNINFEGKNLTGNGGLIPIAQFAQKLKVEETLRAQEKLTSTSSLPSK
ncbi:MAG: hypothetical protein GY941_02675 [Planctomycetes bacterium]|nr:hypothetical protein [Planctomycetota bacterium]